ASATEFSHSFPTRRSSDLSAQESNPTTACRPFDAQRDGLVPSGGGATVILESLESALARGATIIAEVVGYGFSSNGGHISTPNRSEEHTSELQSRENLVCR